MKNSFAFAIAVLSVFVIALVSCQSFTPSDNAQGNTTASSVSSDEAGIQATTGTYDDPHAVTTAPDTTEDSNVPTGSAPVSSSASTTTTASAETDAPVTTEDEYSKRY